MKSCCNGHLLTEQEFWKGYSDWNKTIQRSLSHTYTTCKLRKDPNDHDFYITCGCFGFENHIQVNNHNDWPDDVYSIVDFDKSIFRKNPTSDIEKLEIIKLGMKRACAYSKGNACFGFDYNLCYFEKSFDCMEKCFPGTMVKETDKEYGEILLRKISPELPRGNWVTTLRIIIDNSKKQYVMFRINTKFIIHVLLILKQMFIINGYPVDLVKLICATMFDLHFI